MDIINSNRIRFSAMNQRKYWNAPVFLCQHYRSSDHGRPRNEHTFTIGIFGWTLEFKYRPDGKQ